MNLNFGCFFCLFQDKRQTTRLCAKCLQTHNIPDEKKRRAVGEEVLGLSKACGNVHKVEPVNESFQDCAREENANCVCTQTGLTMSDIPAMELKQQNLRSDNTALKDKLKSKGVLETCSFENDCDKV